MLWYLTLVGHTQSQVGHLNLVILKVHGRSYLIGHMIYTQENSLFVFLFSIKRQLWFCENRSQKISVFQGRGYT